MTAESTTPDLEETPYLAYLAIPVSGFDPVDAVAEFVNKVAIHGLVNFDIVAMDLEDQTVWTVHPDESYEEMGTADADAEALDQEAEDALYARLVERISQIEQEPDEDEDEEPLGRPIVDVELPEPEVVRPKKPKAKKGSAPVTGPCVRCKEENVLNEDGLCPECLVDMEGVTS